MEPIEPQETNTPRPSEVFMVIIAGFFFSLIPQFFFFSLFVEDIENLAMDSFTIKVSLLIGEISLIVVPIYYLWRRNISVVSMFRLNPIPGNVVLVSIVLGFAMTILSDQLDRLFQYILPMPDEWANEIGKMMQANSALELLVIVLSAIVFAALVEEALFRGFLQVSMEEHINVTQAVIYASIAWAFIHVNPYLMVQIFILGFALGYLAWRTDSIYPAVICHGVNNGLAVLTYNVDLEDSFGFYEWGDHVSPLVLVPAGFLLYKGFQYLDEYYRSLTPVPSSNNSSSDD